MKTMQALKQQQKRQNKITLKCKTEIKKTNSKYKKKLIVSNRIKKKLTFSELL